MGYILETKTMFAVKSSERNELQNPKEGDEGESKAQNQRNESEMKNGHFAKTRRKNRSKWFITFQCRVKDKPGVEESDSGEVD